MGSSVSAISRVAVWAVCACGGRGAAKTNIATPRITPADAVADFRPYTRMVYALLRRQKPPTKLRAGGEPVSQGRTPGMNFQQPRKKLWAFRQHADGPRTQPVILGQGQQQISHKRGLPRQFPMCARVTLQVVALHRLCQRNSLPESEPQTLAGDGIDAAGSVSNQRNVTRVDGAKRVHLRNRAAFPAGEFRASDALIEFRAISQH